MAAPQILVHNLVKTYRVPVHRAGLAASIKSLWSRIYRDVEAVKGISFSIDAGEIVGFLGSNGAGKTTTLKMLTGLLHPTSGDAYVAGYVPWRRERAYLSSISMVMGNKSQVSWDIPPLESLRVTREIYQVSRSDFERTLEELVFLLDMRDLLHKPVRTLSLGERMKCELVAALLHRPEVLFLDEPSLGLDISTQHRLRNFIREYNQRNGATVLLTSHYMADVEALCSRIIMISEGQLTYDGSLQELASRFAPHKLLRCSVEDELLCGSLEPLLPDGIEVVERGHGSWTLRVPQSKVPAITSHLLRNLPIIDLSIEEPPIETVVDLVYQKGAEA
ncbi:MAG: ATP-binding cassette domain-containing protein [Ktedonobacteraceae bacterium]|nr:ATP-binding cassette domain-containing protein [Ktedonobacteraceae bacterium]